MAGKEHNIDFTEGKILVPLLRFVFPVLFAMFLQSLYGAVDLFVVGKFAEKADLSAVSTGSQIMMTLTNIVCSFAMGVTIFIGEKTGEKDRKAGGQIIGSGILLFFAIGIVLTILVPALAPQLAGIMNAPEEAFDLTAAYIRICGAGMIVIIAYNLIGSIFRGFGDSHTPLITVMIACFFNIVGDLALVAGFGMGAVGAAIATVAAQMISVIISFFLIRRRKFPFEFDRTCISWNNMIVSKIIMLGLPIGLQDFLVGASFLIVLAIVNSISLDASAGVGVAEKVCGFIMLVPAAFMQAMSAYAAQNRGAGKYDRVFKGLRYAIMVSTAFGIVMFYINFFHGDIMSSIFAKEPEVIAAAADYLKAYAIDCLFTCFLFCFMGFFNGMEYTKFVMIQGIIGAFCVRVPVSFLMSKWEPVSLFHIGLATPCSTVLQIILCFGCLIYLKRRLKTEAQKEDML